MGVEQNISCEAVAKFAAATWHGAIEGKTQTQKQMRKK
jgi:hypothetical protein